MELSTQTDSLARMIAASYKDAPADAVERFWKQEIPVEEREMLEGMADVLMEQPGRAFSHINVNLLYAGKNPLNAEHKFLIFRKNKRSFAELQLARIPPFEVPTPAIEVLGESFDTDPSLSWKRAYLMANSFIERRV